MSATDSGFFPIPEVVLPPLPVRKEATDERGNGFGTCVSCKKFKRVWAFICSLCGECCE
jgi:hypothetical protein